MLALMLRKKCFDMDSSLSLSVFFTAFKRVWTRPSEADELAKMTVQTEVYNRVRARATKLLTGAQ